MNVLVIGSGGREHTLAWKLKQSSKLQNLYVAPGNAGTAQVAQNVPIAGTDFDALADFCQKLAIDMVVVGPEDPLVAGIYDYFSEKMPHVKVIGPSKVGAQLEGSKDFAKQFMIRQGIPTAKAQSFTKSTFEQGVAFLKSMQPPYVLKADGLAAGKGVIIAPNLDEAVEALDRMLLQSQFGAASAQVLIEEFMHGIELSVFALTDGENYVLLPSAKDYKRIGEGDTGLNTGGMGAVSPVPFAKGEFMEKVIAQVVEPTIKGLKKEQIKYVGFVYFGLMNVDGTPKVVEYNARMGDPETEVVIPRLQSDLLELFDLAASGRLNEATVAIDERTATTVMLVSGGYPEDYAKGKEIKGLDSLGGDVLAFHAGTKQEQGKVLTNGGRVLAITALGKNMDAALRQSYAGAQQIAFEQMNYRKDIGFDLKKFE